MGILSNLGKSFRAFANETTKPAPYKKGEAFENYVRTSLFPDSDYSLIYKTHDYTKLNKDQVETSLKPDFRFRDLATGKEFYVETRWRKGTYDPKDTIDWCNEQQLKRYKAIDKFERQVFVVIGIGEDLTQPDSITLFPIKSCDSCTLKPTSKAHYNYTEKPVASKYLWWLE